MPRLAWCVLLSSAAAAGANTLPGAAYCTLPVLAWTPPWSIINASYDATNAHGLEDGIVVRRADGGFSMIAAAMYGDPLWVRMRLDVFRSADGLSWAKTRSLRVSDENFNGSSPHSSSWGPFFTFNPANNSWVLSYVGYRGAPSNSSGWLSNFEGTIFARAAEQQGDAGLDSDFDDAEYAAHDAVLLAPDDFRAGGPWPHPCQGLQGTDSMYAFPLLDGSWAAFVGTSHQETPDPWPQPGGGKWPVSLATAPALLGPWTRRNPAGGPPADAPCVDLNGAFSENPVVSRRADNASVFQVVHDVINAERTGFGYGCSLNGLDWPATAVVALPAGCRTPFGLVPMTAAEVAARTPDILAFGAVNASQLAAPGATLSWLFYSVQAAAFEEVRAAVMYFPPAA